MNKKRLLCLMLFAILLSYSSASAQKRKLEKYTYRFLNATFTKMFAPNKRLILVVLPKYSYSYNLDSMLNFEFLQEAQFSFSESPAKIKQLLSANDLEYMKQQVVDWGTTRFLDSGKLKAISENLVVRYSKPKTDKEYELSFYIFPPLFNVKGDYCFLYVENYCGIECGGGQLNLYKKQKNGTWKVVYIVPTWVS